jgi:hypothetical protein
MAYEDFMADTIADEDVKPYVPANWKPVYGFEALPDSMDMSGFVLQIDSVDTALAYQHREGVKYPVTCLLAPSTNLAWKNYTFSGTIIKPNQPSYDTVIVGIVAYQKSETERYVVTFEKDGVYLEGGGLGRQLKDPLQFTAGDTLSFEFEISSIEINGVPDSLIEFTVRAGLNVAQVQQLFDPVSDTTVARVVEGFPAILINKSTVSLSHMSALQPLRIRGAYAVKNE